MKQEYLNVLMEEKNTLKFAIANAIEGKIYTKKGELRVAKDYVRYFGSTSELEEQIEELRSQLSYYENLLKEFESEEHDSYVMSVAPTGEVLEVKLLR